jgi:light-independent protochlorophyllide reductase subunit B
MGVLGTREFIEEVASLAGVDPSPVLDREHPGEASLASSQSRLPWFAHSVDSTYLTGKRVFIFADATHAIAAARMAKEEFGFNVVGLGTYSREYAREVRAAAATYGLAGLITDDYLEVEQAIAEASPELVLGTQMERHISKRLGIPCAVISAPIHVQDAPARYSPVFGFEGANVTFDAWTHPLAMGLEEHLLQMFRGDFEFRDDVPSSHVHPVAKAPTPANEAVTASANESLGHEEDPPAGPAVPVWTADGKRELKKIPFFVRGKARRNTELFARERGLAAITVETLYDAKAHFGR